jgi:hypothetical protein
VGRLTSRDRCLFAERCPYVMDGCWQARPPAYPTGAQRAACYLHRPDAPIPAPIATEPLAVGAEPTVVP